MLTQWQGTGRYTRTSPDDTKKKMMAAVFTVLANRRSSFVCTLLLCLAIIAPSSTLAEERGPVTNLPMPRFVSLKVDEANVRRGPSLSHKIDWVFKKRNMPLVVVGEYEHWRRVQDIDGAGGWIHYSLISGTRTVIVTAETLDILMQPDANAPVNARLEIGVIANLGKCDLDWCQIRAGGYRGWARKTGLWGVDADEIRE